MTEWKRGGNRQEKEMSAEFTAKSRPLYPVAKAISVEITCDDRQGSCDKHARQGYIVQCFPKRIGRVRIIGHHGLSGR